MQDLFESSLNKISWQQLCERSHMGHYLYTRSLWEICTNLSTRSIWETTLATCTKHVAPLHRWSPESCTCHLKQSFGPLVFKIHFAPKTFEVVWAYRSKKGHNTQVYIDGIQALQAWATNIRCTMFSTSNAVLDLNLDHAADLKNTTLLRVIPTPRHKFWHWMVIWNDILWYDMYIYIYILSFYLKFYLAFYLAFYLTHILPFYIFYLIYFLTFYLTHHLTFYLASYLTGIWRSQLGSGSAHWALELAVEVRQCPLRFGLAIRVREYRLRSGARNYVRQCPLRSGGGGWRGEEEGGRKQQVSSLIKSSSHHLQSESAESWHLLYYQSEVAVLSWHIHPSPRWERITNTHKDI